MQIDYKSILNQLLTIGKVAVLENLSELEGIGTDYVSNLISRLSTVADDYKERKDWEFVKARINDEAKMFVANVHSVIVLEETKAEVIGNNFITWGMGYLTGLLGKQ